MSAQNYGPQQLADVSNTGRLELKARMQRAQFEMGQDRATPATTYTANIDGAVRLMSAQSTVRDSQAALALRNRKTNISFGTDGQTDTSEFKQAYPAPKGRNLGHSQSQSLVREMTTPHFSLA